MSTIYSKLVAEREDLGGYHKYVFQNQDTGEYILCTRFPNWETPPVELFSIGYLQCKEIIAGKDLWYDVVSNSFIPYNYDMIQFIDFIEKKTNTTKIVM